VNHIVEVRYTGGDWADLVADMRSWLDRRQIEAEGFSHSVLGRSVAVRVGFRDEHHADAFATAFSGLLQSANPGRATAGTIARLAGDDAGPAFSKGSKASAERLPESVQPASQAPRAWVSLMITRQQKAELRERGYSDEQIRDMKPGQAHRVLGLI
jgi:hypothetical protein